MIFSYKVFGLVVHSQVPLPELNETDIIGAQSDVAIKLESFPTWVGERRDGFAVTEGGSVLNVPGAARYLIRNGREILIDKDPEGSERHLRLFLLGSAFGAILHQRRLLPLHANAVQMRQHAVAFMGMSGAGKSTMAAWFYDRGHAILSDDVCVVTSQDGAPLAHLGIPRLRLWRDALEQSGRNPERFDLSFDDADKYNVPTERLSAPSELPLGAVYLLDTPAETDQGPEIRRLSGIEALEALIANTYRGAYVPLMGATQHHLSSCLTLANSIPIFAIRRVWGRATMDEQLEGVQQHAEDVLESKAGLLTEIAQAHPH